MTPAYRIVITPRAGTDIASIHDHIAKQSPAAAAGVVTGILDAMEALATTPHRTVVSPQPASRRPPDRSLAAWPYTVFFRVFDDSNVVRVVRVRHGARRPLKRFD